MDPIVSASLVSGFDPDDITKKILGTKRISYHHIKNFKGSLFIRSVNYFFGNE